MAMKIATSFLFLCLLSSKVLGDVAVAPPAALIPAQAPKKPLPNKAAAKAATTPPAALKKVAPPAVPAAISQLADAIQKQYNKTHSATFDFEQSYKHPFLPVNETSKGQVFFKSRNMLWRYNEPSDRKKEFFIEGKKFTYHLVKDKLAFTHDCFEKDTLSASITFLWGQGRLKDSFEIKEYQAALASPLLKWITLIPKEKNAPVKSISLGVDPKTAIVVESIVTDLSDGINSFRFSNFKTNPSIPENTFRFKAAPGVKVQPMPNIVCNEPKAAPVIKKTPSPMPATKPHG
jgi:outer membrane lipoprotein carrier protein